MGVIEIIVIEIIVIEMIDKIEVKKLNVFMECFNHVSAKFSELYYNFFEGEGKLELKKFCAKCRGHKKHKETKK